MASHGQCVQPLLLPSLALPAPLQNARSLSLDNFKCQSKPPPLYLCSPYALQQQGGLGSGFPASRLSAADSYTDIRYDEDYDKFYHSTAGTGVKLPPPLDHRTLYHDLPQFSQPPAGGDGVRLRPPSALGLNGGGGFGELPACS